MSLWIKICGNTSRADAEMAVEAGADAVGFVFAPSPRQVTAGDAAAIVRRLPAAIEKIGVFVDATVEEIDASVRASGLTGVQLHFDAGVEVPGRLRERLGPAVRILRVVHFDAAQAERFAREIAVHVRDPHVDGVLIDSRTATAVGGTGVAFDWSSAARALVQSEEVRKHLVAAGGLNAANVAEAIATLRPWGVDVVSGVEATPGRKDPAKVREFIARARAAQSK
ncbi:MAG: phosphoribosylanthranilate isomerase [Terracidiphilus sp.]|nr:phosphoribosylanthranilate isomerase [Terracidiphilus sp.]